MQINQTVHNQDPSMERLLRSRELSEQQASSSKSTHNRVRASQLAELLHEYRSNAVPGQLPVLAKKYGIDEDVLKRLVDLVNNPSYNPDSVERIVGKDGQERISMMVHITYYTHWCHYLNVFFRLSGPKRCIHIHICPNSKECYTPCCTSGSNSP